jgi:NAD(P)-dependent dehydrogenase (short-subunit alcohol dehydrogenase family)
MAAETTKPVALITGGTTGIGLATARLLNEKGFAVLITGANPETLAAARRSLASDILTLKADATQPMSLPRCGSASGRSTSSS